MPAPNRGRLNIREVARRAGVSHMTVSRVINGSANISPETRAHVQAILDQLGFQPNAMARGLAQGRSRQVGLLIESSSHYGPMSTLRAMDVAARSAGYASLSFTVKSGSTAEMREGLDSLTAHDVAGLAIITSRVTTLAWLSGLRLPRATVLLGSPPLDPADPAERTDLDRVWIDQQRGSRLAVEHLIAAGHRVIGHLAGPSDWFDAQWRHTTWEACLNDAGLTVPPVAMGDWHAQSGFEASDELLQIPDLTAVFAANDQMALGLIHGLSRRGVRVPEDISVVGFDDQPDSGHFLPPLTTVHQDFETLGDAGITAFLAQLDGAGDGVRHHVEPHLVVRSSTRPVLSR